MHSGAGAEKDLVGTAEKGRVVFSHNLGQVGWPVGNLSFPMTPERCPKIGIIICVQTVHRRHLSKAVPIAAS